MSFPVTSLLPRKYGLSCAPILLDYLEFPISTKNTELTENHLRTFTQCNSSFCHVVPEKGVFKSQPIRHHYWPWYPVLNVWSTRLTKSVKKYQLTILSDFREDFNVKRLRQSRIDNTETRARHRTKANKTSKYETKKYVLHGPHQKEGEHRRLPNVTKLFLSPI